MKEYTFRKFENILYITSEGWTSEYTPDGEVDTSIEHHLGEEITQLEAEEILLEYGWVICKNCGNIVPDGPGCMCEQLGFHPLP